ncbi:unnamed protein product [Pleuronectes platessa]|uniref:Uncharacterized protein n=1 Tax=Pleuronectes platessa TaxID=8262 RepID=A0A9N7YZI7_PLEPL|nr:unnamed protein product [Pleuronectes platessa]
MAVNIPGVILMVLFYLLLLGTGIWASFKSKREQKKSGANETEMTLLGNRSINWMVGIFTMTGEDSSAEDNRTGVNLGRILPEQDPAPLGFGLPVFRDLFGLIR